MIGGLLCALFICAMVVIGGLREITMPRAFPLKPSDVFTKIVFGGLAAIGTGAVLAVLLNGGRL